MPFITDLTLFMPVYYRFNAVYALFRSKTGSQGALRSKKVQVTPFWLLEEPKGSVLGKCHCSLAL